MALSRKDVKQWVADDESETQEFKTRTSKGCLAEAVRTICGFSNTRGGRVVFGIDPSGEIVGQDATEKTSRTIAAALSEIEPPVFPQIELIEIGKGKSVVAVTAEKGSRRPYTYKDKAYRRVGSTTVTMDRESYNEMLLEELHSTSRWENQPAVRWGLDDLDRAEISRTVEEGIRRGRIPEPATRDTKDLLRGLGLLASDGKPLRAAVVLFAKSDRILPDFPQCRVRLARFKGVDKGQFIDNRQYEDNAFRLLQISDEFLRQHLPVAG
jgi:ATP-dependent DNA helicase RecG